MRYLPLLILLTAMPLGAADWAPLASRVRLEDVLRLTAEASPAVQAAAHRWHAAAQKPAQAGALPDPTLDTQLWLRQMAEEEEKWMVGLNQTFPLGGKRKLAARAAGREAEAARLKYQAALRDAIADAKEAFFELYYIDRAAGVTREAGKLYERYAALASGGPEPGRPKLPETFRAESQRAQLGYDLVLLEEMRRSESERLRAAMGAPASAPLGPISDVKEPSGSLPPIERLRDEAARHSQELAAAGVEAERARVQASLAAKNTVPDLMLGAAYMRTGGQGMPGGDPTDDPILLKVGLTLPIWGGKNRAARREAREAEAAARAEVDVQGLKVRSDLAKAYFSLGNSLRLVELYRGTLIPQARSAMQSAEALYWRREANLASVLETTATVQGFELARLRATADFYQNAARIERVIGAPMELGK